MTQHHATMLDACTCALRNMRMMEDVEEKLMRKKASIPIAYEYAVARYQAIGECIAALKSEMEAVKLAVDK